jgi:hypothetical protein
VKEHILPTVIVAVLANLAPASDPARAGRVKKAGPTAVVQINPMAQVMAALAARDRQLVRDIAECLVHPQPQIAQFILRRCEDDPNFRMQRLLNESEDLGQAREEFHRFWRNNKPSVLTAERLKGAIGP